MNWETIRNVGYILEKNGLSQKSNIGKTKTRAFLQELAKNFTKMSTNYYDEVEAFMDRADRCCFLDGTDPLKSGPVNRISPDDQEQLFGSYMANFILPGLLALMSGKD